MKKAINELTRVDLNRLSENIGYMDSVDEYGNNFDFYQRTATKSAVYPGRGTFLGVMYCALKLNGEAGELAEHVGKALRDDDMVESLENGLQCDLFEIKDKPAPERHALIVKEIGDCLWYLSAICNELGITLSDAAIANIAKLVDRSERDALQGSGDER